MAFVFVRRLKPNGILFYQGLATGILFSLILFVFLIISVEIEILTAIKDAFFLFTLIYIFIFTIPTTVDRAYSVEMLNRLAKHDNGLSEEEINSAYIEYFLKKGGVKKRIQEQYKTGTIINNERGKYVLTSKGRAFTWAFRLTALLFNCGSNLEK